MDQQHSATLTRTTADLVALARHFHLPETSPSSIRAKLHKLRDILALLDFLTCPTYFTGTDQGSYLPLSSLSHVHCSFVGCEVTSAEPDACLLNFAQANSPSLWLCRAHHPSAGAAVVVAPGWTPDAGRHAQVEAARREVFARLTPYERHLLNSRIVYTAAPESAE